MTVKRMLTFISSRGTESGNFRILSVEYDHNQGLWWSNMHVQMRRDLHTATTDSFREVRHCAVRFVTGNGIDGAEKTAVHLELMHLGRDQVQRTFLADQGAVCSVAVS
jgi:hypothetical protein